MTIQLFTMGFADKSAETFFTLLHQHNIRNVIDVRLSNRFPLAGFARQEDFTYFLKNLLDVTYRHREEFAPTKHLLNDFKKGVLTWEQYEYWYNSLLLQRQPQQHLIPERLDHACLLCREVEPDHCHRRLAAEYLQYTWPDISIHHIGAILLKNSSKNISKNDSKAGSKNHEASLVGGMLCGLDDPATTAGVASGVFT